MQTKKNIGWGCLLGYGGACPPNFEFFNYIYNIKILLKFFKL